MCRSNILDDDCADSMEEIKREETTLGSKGGKSVHDLMTAISKICAIIIAFFKRTRSPEPAVGDRKHQ